MTAVLLKAGFVLVDSSRISNVSSMVRNLVCGLLFVKYRSVRHPFKVVHPYIDSGSSVYGTSRAAPKTFEYHSEHLVNSRYERIL